MAAWSESAPCLLESMPTRKRCAAMKGHPRKRSRRLPLVCVAVGFGYLSASRSFKPQVSRKEAKSGSGFVRFASSPSKMTWPSLRSQRICFVRS